MRLDALAAAASIGFTLLAACVLLKSHYGVDVFSLVRAWLTDKTRRAREIEQLNRLWNVGE